MVVSEQEPAGSIPITTQSPKEPSSDAGGHFFIWLHCKLEVQIVCTSAKAILIQGPQE